VAQATSVSDLRTWPKDATSLVLTLKQKATVKRFHHGDHNQLRDHLDIFISADNFGRRLMSLKGALPTNTSANTDPANPKGSP
jgi:hypothetical protein